MVGFVKALDATRPVGLAQCVPESAKSQLPAALDVAGWNYARRYAISRERWPNLPIVYSESASAFSMRGYYDDFPMPAKKDDYPSTARISSYDHNSAWYSDPADVEFALMEKDHFVAGEFVCYVYTGGDSAELFLNGKSLGLRTKNPNAEVVRDRYALRWLDVPYQPGELKAVAYRNGRKLGSAVMRTAGEPAKMRLTPDHKSLSTDGDDVSYVLVEALDKSGNFCPLAMNDVKFKLEGAATIAGVGNGDHHFPAEFKADHVTLFYVKAILIVRAAESNGGTIRVAATSDSLGRAEISLRSRAARQLNSSVRPEAIHQKET